MYQPQDSLCPGPTHPLGKHINLRILRAQQPDMLGPNFIHQWDRTNLETDLYTSELALTPGVPGHLP